jgi:hypothetical protein
VNELQSNRFKLNSWFSWLDRPDVNDESKLLNVRQRKNIRWVHSAWEPVDDQCKKLQQLGRTGVLGGSGDLVREREGQLIRKVNF